MKLLLALCLSFSSSALLFAQEPSAPSGDQAAVAASEKQWLKAFVDRDEATMTRLLSPDCWLVDSQGSRASRADLIADLTSGNYLVKSMHADDLQVRVAGDWAIVVGLETEQSSTNGQDSSGQFRFLDTWQKRDGKWLCLASAAVRVKSE